VFLRARLTVRHLTKGLPGNRLRPRRSESRVAPSRTDGHQDEPDYAEDEEKSTLRVVASSRAKDDPTRLRRRSDRLDAAREVPAADGSQRRRLDSPIRRLTGRHARVARARGRHVSRVLRGRRLRQHPLATNRPRARVWLSVGGAARARARAGDNTSAWGRRRWTDRPVWRRGSRHNSRSGGLSGGRSLRRSRGSLLLPLREQQLRVDVAVRVGGQAHAEVDVGLGAFGLAARPDRADDFALCDSSPHTNGDRPQVNQGDRVAVLGTDRQAAALTGNLARERDDPGRRSAHLSARRRADVDSAVLPASVRVVTGDEGPEHWAVDRPAPSGRARHESQRGKENDCDAVAYSENHAGRVPSRVAVVKPGYSEAW